MKRFLGALCVLVACETATMAATAGAQQAGDFVLPPGMARLRVGLEYAHFDSRFGSNGAVGLGAPLLTPLTSATFAPAAVLERELNRFFAATDATAGGAALRATPENLLFGTPDLEVSADVRVVPLGLELGVAPRVQVGVELPVFRSETRLLRFGVLPGTVGLNPDVVGNARALAALGPEFGALGTARLLPLAGSALGAELQRRVRALGGGELQLPAAVADTLRPALLNQLLRDEFGIAPLASETSDWQVGDLVVGAAVRVLGDTGDNPYPADSAGVRYRVSLSGSVRLPTGAQDDSVRLFRLVPDAGLSGWQAGARGDVFVGDRWWVAGSARVTGIREVEVSRRLVSPALPLAAVAEPQPVRWSPGAELELRLAPRYRITDAIAIGAEYELLSVGASSFRLAGGEVGDAGVLDEPGGTFQRVGASLRYSTLPAYFAGAGLLPVDVALGYETTVAGPAGGLAESLVWVQASVLRRLWGRER